LIPTGIFESEVYNKLFEEFVKESIHSEEQIPGLSNVFVYHWHTMVDIPEEERFDPIYKKAFLLEIATQFRAQEILLNLQFNGFGIHHDGGGFSTDISETCHWLSPFVLEPEDYSDLK
jgi:hypothetical protein